jgi:hypothetical protein
VEEKTIASIVEDMSRVKAEHAETRYKDAEARRRASRAEERLALFETSGAFPHPLSWDASQDIITWGAGEDCDMSGSRWADCNDIPRTKDERIARDEHINRPPLPWYQPDSGRIFGESPIETCAESYQYQLERELELTVKRISQQTEAMPEGTVRLCNLKAVNERDLAYMQEQLDSSKRAVAKIEMRRSARRQQASPSKSSPKRNP